MLKGKTKSGFEYRIEEKRLDNYEFVEAVSEVDENPLLLPKVINLLLGKDQAKLLKEHLRDEEGLISTEALSNEIQQMFTEQTTLKNSSSLPGQSKQTKNP